MALKDLKSDLSKFRMPKKEPLEGKARVDVNTNQNLTPLDSLAAGVPNPSKPNKTTDKRGVSVSITNKTPITPDYDGYFKETAAGSPKIDYVSKKEPFKGETTPIRDNSTPISPDWEGYYTNKIPNATDTSKIKQGDKFKGETSPTQMDNSEKFKGETSPTPMDNSEKFKGETTPTEINQTEKFKGETTPTEINQTEKFKGETDPKPMSLEERFLGETEPNKMDNSEKFLGETNPTQMDNSEKFLGETTPKSENNTGQFLGETNPTPMSLEERFLGETTPTEINQTEKFKGETEPIEVTQGDKFKGGVEVEKVIQGDKFKGETEPTEFNNTSNFVRFSNEEISSPFATEPNKMNLDAKFLGETDTKPMSLEERFLGETTPTDKDSTGQFLGETTPTEVEQGDKFKGETEPTVMSLGDKFKGETTPARFPYILRQENEGKEPGKVNYIEDLHANGFTSNMYPIGGPKKPSQFIGVDPSQTQFDGATSLYGKLGLTNFIVDDDATGFTKDMFPIGGSKKPSQFIGVDSAGTIFDEKASDYSNTKSLYEGLSYRPGYGRFKFDKETGNVQRYSESNKYLIDNELTRLGISQLQEMRSSPSFLDKMYDKYNLRDDAFNLGTAAFAHPLILRGIQRKGIDKGEPQKWGFGFPVDDGLVRGGIVTATDRAVVDAVRLGKWMVSVQGLLWGIKNVGLQASNSNVETTTGKRLTKTWTPTNTIASTLGGFIGLRPKRHGITPFDSDDETYETVQTNKRITHVSDPALAAPITGNRLVGLWAESFITIGNISKSQTSNGPLFARLQSLGGPNSLYGLIPNGRVPTRNENTRPDDFTGYTIFNQYATFRLESDGSRDAAEGSTRALNVSNPETSEDNFGDKTELGKKIKSYTEFAPNQKSTSDPNFAENKIAGKGYNDESPYNPKGEQFDPDSTPLGLNANNLPGSFLNNTKNTEGVSHPIEKNDTAAEIIKNYETMAYGSIPTREAGNPEVNDFRKDFTTKLGYRDADYSNGGIESRTGLPNHAFSIGGDRSDYNNPNFTVRDEINALDLDEKGNDLIQFWIKADGGQKCQFRGTVSGITETFSPSWDSFKYNGRADQAYKYTTFERSLSLNFKAYASSRAEMKPMYKKLQYLATMTMPVYGGGGYHGVLVTFRLGDLYGKESSGKLAFIESLTYTMSDETPWDINLDGNLGELPMGVDIAIGFKILDGIRPERGAQIYDWDKLKKKAVENE